MKDPKDVALLACSLYSGSVNILKEMRVRANLSKALFFDAALHWLGDSARLMAREPKGIRPAKHVAYLAFWIRKIKPISRAYPVAVWAAAANAGTLPDPTYEIVDINERLAIKYAFEVLADFSKNEKVTIHTSGEDDAHSLKYNEGLYKDFVTKYCEQKLGNSGKTVFETLVHNMRYRTFGPHHLVHIFDQVVFGLETQNNGHTSFLAGLTCETCPHRRNAEELAASELIRQ